MTYNRVVIGSNEYKLGIPAHLCHEDMKHNQYECLEMLVMYGFFTVKEFESIEVLLDEDFPVISFEGNTCKVIGRNKSYAMCRALGLFWDGSEWGKLA